MPTVVVTLLASVLIASDPSAARTVGGVAARSFAIASGSLVTGSLCDTSSGIDGRTGGGSSARLAANGTTFKDWVESGVAQAALSYDPQVTPAFLLEPVGACATRAPPAVNIFLLGDSLNRIMIDDACAMLGGQAGPWTEGFAYRVDASPDNLCRARGGNVAFLNIYGSAPRGPYYGNHTATAVDPWADTEQRLAHGLDQFVARVGEPTFILFRTELWDLHVTAYIKAGIDKEAVFRKFAADNRASFAYIRRRFPHAELMLHTVPTITWGLSLFHHYQNANRYLARASVSDPDFAADTGPITNFDFQLLLLDLPKEAYLRDTHHPTPIFLASFLDMMFKAAAKWVEACA